MTNRKRLYGKIAWPCLTGLLLSGTMLVAGALAAANEYLDMDIGQLMQITITSVSKRPQVLSDSSAAVFVITSDDIARSGVTSIPEALRMVPGIQVARIGSEKWAVTARGFNGQTANKLLVLMDGRSVYNPAFSGVFWNTLDTLLEDIDRIEVIRGPGGTIWGANAVNGIINIITKNAHKTRGSLVRLGGGNKEHLYSGLRYGAAINDTVSARVYMTYRDLDSFDLYMTGEDAHDSWDTLRGGFRMDGEGDRMSWTLQGDIFTLNSDQIIDPYLEEQPPYRSLVDDNYDNAGWNILGRWQYRMARDNVVTLQAYYDRDSRNELVIGADHDIVDLELRDQLKIGRRHDLIWGMGYRYIHDSFRNTPQVSFEPVSQSENLFSGFIQDEILLVRDRLWLTLGSKIEHNDYTGYEIQPSGRLLYKPAREHIFWGAVSRAVRTPSRVEQDGRIFTAIVADLPPYPALFYIEGSDAYTSEKVLTYELGYRWLASSSFSVDLSLFYNDYDDLRTSTPLTPFSDPVLFFENKSYGTSHGLELALDWQARPWLLFQLSYAYANFDLKTTNGDVGLDFIVVDEKTTPHNQVSLRSNINWGEGWQGNVWLRYVDSFAASGKEVTATLDTIDSYLTADVNVSWQVTDKVNVMLIGQNLLDGGHLEFFSEYLAPMTEIGPSVLGKVTWRF
jgi:iron complex outermembrane receptor protein